jgi:hypothetical protein
MFYTYAHYKPDNSVFYIGKGRGRRAWSNKNRNPHWRNVIAKHGEPKVEVLAQWPTEEEAFEHEKFLIWCFRDMGCSMVNITNGGEGVSGYKPTQESIQKRLDSMKGYTPTEETRSKMREAHLGEKNHFFGRNHSEAAKQLISDAKKANPSTPWLGKSRSEETRQKIALSLLGKSGRKHTEESKRKIALAKTGKKQASPSEDTRKKLSESVKASWVLRRQKARKEV